MTVTSKSPFVVMSVIVLATLFIFSAAGVLAACASANPARQKQPEETAKHRFLALGDSYTIGESVAESERWPVQLAAKLKERGVSISTPHIIAKTGWTTDELKRGVEADRPTGNYGLVTLLIGVNNQYRKRSPEQYRAEFREMLQQAIGYAGGDAAHVVVLSIPDWGVTPFAVKQGRPNISAEIDEFNRINREETEAAKAHYVDITPISREAKDDPTLIAKDGLHPSGKMYSRWVEAALPALPELK
jgi:lysophospholipase L1-like esterase